jgi:hypothetical protein
VWGLNNPGIHYGLSVVLMCIIHPHYAKLSICIAYCQRLVMQFSNVFLSNKTRGSFEADR